MQLIRPARSRVESEVEYQGRSGRSLRLPGDNSGLRYAGNKAIGSKVFSITWEKDENVSAHKRGTHEVQHTFNLISIRKDAPRDEPISDPTRVQ